MCDCVRIFGLLLWRQFCRYILMWFGQVDRVVVASIQYLFCDPVN